MRLSPSFVFASLRGSTYDLGKRLFRQAMGGRVEEYTLRLFARCGRSWNEASWRFGVRWVRTNDFLKSLREAVQPRLNSLRLCGFARAFEFEKQFAVVVSGKFERDGAFSSLPARMIT